MTSLEQRTKNKFLDAIFRNNITRISRWMNSTTDTDVLRDSLFRIEFTYLSTIVQDGAVVAMKIQCHTDRGTAQKIIWFVCDENINAFGSLVDEIRESGVRMANSGTEKRIGYVYLLNGNLDAIYFLNYDRLL